MTSADGKRQLVSRQPAGTPDAPGGVRALTVATDEAVQTLAVWLAHLEAAR